MPRWPDGYVSRRTCPKCGGKKDFYAEFCRACAEWKKPLAGRTGENHPAWKGGLSKDKDGYIKRYDPSHPWPRAGGYVREHIRIMELAMGRRLAPDEVVHHKDGDIENNDLSNLEVLRAGQHSQHHRAQDISRRQRDDRGRFR